MRRFMLISLAIILPSVVTTAKVPHGFRIKVGTELIPVIMRQAVSFNISHPFTSRWSVDANVSVNPWKIAKGLSEDETIHYSIMEEKSPRTVSPCGGDFHSATISFQYWTKDSFYGPFIGIGIRYGDIHGTDCMIEAGYRIILYSGLGMNLSVRTCLFESLIQETYHLTKINLGLNYAF